MSGQSLPKGERIRKRADFVRIQGTGRKVATANLLAFVLPSDLGLTRIGLTVSKRVGKAVVRVRVKRLLRESFRRQKTSSSSLGNALPKGVDIVFVARSSAKESSYEDLYKEVEEICKRVPRLLHQWRRP